MSSRMKIDCVVLPCDQKKYVLPMNAVVEVIPIFKGIAFLTDSHSLNKMHRITWNEFEIPLITSDFNAFKIKGTQFEKIMIVHAIFSENCQRPHFFGLYINGEIWRKTLFPKTVKWVDEDQKIVQIIDEEVVFNATIFDLFSSSTKIEKLRS